MKTNLLKSIFISLILVMGVANMSAATITSDGTARLYFNMQAISWWTAGNNGDGNFAYFFNNSTGKNAWSAHSVQYSDNTYYVVIPAGTWEKVILTRNNTSTAPSWDNDWNQTGDIELSSASNYLSKFKSGSDGEDPTWGTAVKPASTGSLSASSASVNIGDNVTLTPSLTSNTDINAINSTAYSINPSSGASISDNTFTATAEGTYTITATITYNPKGYAGLTSTTTATTTITVKSLKPTTIYLKPNSNWKQASARFAIYCWNSSGNKWLDMTKIDCDGDYYTVKIPGEYSDFKFVRMNPATTDNNFNNGTKWNETGDLKVPTDDKVLFTVANTNDWNGATTTWSTMSTYPTYTITLNRQSGTTGDESVTATYGSAAPSAEMPTRTGHTFEGYYTQANGQGDLYIDKNGAWQDIAGIVDGKWMKPACNLTLYAKWKKNTYKVTITATNGGSVDKDGEKEVGGEGLQVTASPSDGYSFSYWEVTGDVSVADSKSATTIITATGIGTVTAHFEITLYLETNEHWREYNADFAVHAYIDEHANEWFNLTRIDCSKYYKVTIPAKYSNVIFCRMNPDRSNKDNNGGEDVMWTKTQDMSISDVKNVCFQITNDHWGEDKVITEGQWIAYPGTYTIILNQTNGGTITTSSASPVAPNTEVTVTMTPNPGYSFESGKITIGTGAELDINAESTHTICGNTTISAQWLANTYTVIFHANGGKGDMEDQEFTYDKEQILTANAFTRTGYTFAGWATTSDGESTYADGANVKNLTTENGGKVTLYAKWSEIKYEVTISSADENNGSVSPSGDRQIGISGISVTATPNNGFQFAGWEVTGGAQVADENSATTTITAKEPGTVTAHFKELELKTIYLKTVEDTKDGDKWFVVYGGQEHEMTPLGCTGEYYRGEVPEGTSFQFVSRDASTNIVETKGTNLQYVEGKTLYNLVSAAASGDKIFFNPNTSWLSTNWNNDKSYEGQTPRFAALFDGKTWLDMTDNNDDKIFECVKPSGATKVYFCRMKPYTTANSWDEKWQQTDEQTIPNGKNLFTLPADVSLTDWARGGTWSEIANSPVNGEGEWITFTGITYRITFNQQDATTAGTTHVDVAYHASMPEIEKLPTQTEKKFGGYYTEAGVMLVNAFGEWQDAMGYIASGTWESEACLTLHAHWTDLTPEITDVTLNADIFEPVDDDKEGIVTADPTINEHNNTTLEYIVCWKLLYSNGREVEGTQEDPDKYKATVVEGEGDKVKFSIAGLATGNYIIRASLRTGSDCNSGKEISRYDKQFSIVANRIVTVNYTCDGREIMASTKQNAHVINPTSIKAPDIIGYTFKEWVAGDGVIISTADKTSENIEFTAYYDGYLTATYTKNENIIYFYNTLGWQNVYVYFYSSFKIDGNEVGYWNDKKGTGSQPKTNDNDWYGGSYKGYAQMEQIAGTDIWYVNASEKSTTYLAFCKDQQDKYDFFFATEVVRRNDYNKTLPMYVPIKAAPEYKNHKNSDKTTYYNKGYWMNYPENTGYKLQIYDGTGNGAKEVASIRFPYSSNTIMPLTVSVDLEAGKTYGFKILREDNTYFSNKGTMTANSNGWSFTYGIDQNCGLQTTLAGDYTFTLKYAAPDNKKPNDYQYCVDVVYPVSVGDYRVVYTDNAQWSQTAAHGAKWYHPSYAIKKNSSATEVKTDIVSFFIAKNNSPAMKFQKCTAINGQTVTWEDVTNGTITIPNDVVTAAGVYNFIVKQPAGGESISVESVEPYTGNYYIRVDAMDGKWGNYKTDPDNRMTYSAFSENRSKNKFGELFSHYATKWCEEGTNVKFTIANDYSPCISDTLIQDNGNPFGNINEHGNLNSNEGKYAANIRFMWNRHTNKISRAYVAGSTFTDRQFLILKADKEFKNSAGGNLSNEGDDHNAHQAIFQDTQNWIYERTIQVQPSTRVKLYACYPTTDVANAQYFRGTYDNNNATWNEDNSVQILGGTGASWNTIRIIYDFKTNRLMAAWIPTGEIDGEKSLQADMMILREHQEDAACITFKDTDDKLLNIQTVYGVLRFNRWVLNNRKATGGHEALDVKDQKTIYERALYFISFPFDVHLSDVFGFGTYGTHWVISEYNGLRRAQNGYFVDNCMNEDCTNWDYIWDPSDFTMKANQGYLLSLDLDLMKDNNESFWAHGINTVELYFPSYEHVQTIQQTDYTMDALGEKYRCTINYSNLPGHTKDSDRRVKDSYWRCIGVPSFADYNSTLTDGTNPITWKPKGNEFPFLYEWNVSDNSLMVCAASQYKFRPTFAYLVQNGNEIHWSAVNATPPPTSIAARQRTDVERNYEWKITLSRDDNQEDQTFLRMTDNEEVSEAFDFNQDLVKELNYGRSDIYTLIGYEKAAANSMPFSENTTVVPLGLDIEQDGDYTIAMPEGVENVGVTLLDAETGERTNLSIGMDYTISLNKGACHNRLYLEISPIQQTPTDIEYTDQGTREQSVRKVLIDGKLYIVCDSVVYDAQGKRL